MKTVPFLKVEHLYFNYPTSKNILTDISFEVKEGETIGILGANGSGKSTLLHILASILKSDQGSAHFKNILIDPKNLNQLRSHIGLSFQDAGNQLFMPIVREDIAFGVLNNSQSTEDIHTKTDNMMSELSISHLANKHTHQISGGEKRMVALASILIMNPQLLLLDEPSSNLDPRARRQLIDCLKTRTETKIITTHDLDLAYELCDRCLILDQGNIIADGSPSEIFANKQVLAEAQLEQPKSYIIHQLESELARYRTSK